MKPLLLPALALLVTVASAGETRPAPQPRLRLDPTTLSALVMPAPEANVVTAGSVILMEKVVVNERKLLPPRLPAPLLPSRDKFSIRDGGRFYGKNVGALRVEVGFWPSIDYLASGSFVKLRAEPRLNVDMFRISW